LDHAKSVGADGDDRDEEEEEEEEEEDAADDEEAFEGAISNRPTLTTATNRFAFGAAGRVTKALVRL
jgi:hypothetical protein